MFVLDCCVAYEIGEDTKTAWRMATDSNSRQGVRAVATTTTDPQRSEKRAVAARGAAGALALSILALVLQSATTATPTWGYFTNPDGESCFWNSFDSNARISLMHRRPVPVDCACSIFLAVKLPALEFIVAISIAYRFISLSVSNTKSASKRAGVRRLINLFRK